MVLFGVMAKVMGELPRISRRCVESPQKCSRYPILVKFILYPDLRNMGRTSTHDRNPIGVNNETLAPSEDEVGEIEDLFAGLLSGSSID